MLMEICKIVPLSIPLNPKNGVIKCLHCIYYCRFEIFREGFIFAKLRICEVS